MKIRYDRIAGGLAIGALSVAALVGAYEFGQSRVESAPIAAPVVNEDPYNGVPQCTDSIADSGGICHGEPIADVGIPTPTETSVVNEDPVPTPAATVVVPGPTKIVNDLPACVMEDSDNCFWDAGTAGNGEGESFVAFHGKVYYLDAPVKEDADDPHTGTVELNGEKWSYTDGWDTILYCIAPLKVGIDVDDKGNEWAGCM